MSRDMVKALENIAQNPFVTSSVRSGKQSKCSILMIDDDYEYLLILSRFVASQSVQVEIDTEWWAVVNKCNLSTFDLIVCDLNMPKYNGMDVLSYVNQYLEDIPVLFMTSLDELGIRAMLPDKIRETHPIICKSKGISFVCNQIQFLVQSWFEERTMKQKESQ